jgi:hypothetical protein
MFVIVKDTSLFEQADDKRIRCIRDTPFNKWKRIKKDSSGFKSDPFKDLHDIFDPAILQVQEQLRLRGLKLIPIEKYQHSKIVL